MARSNSSGHRSGAKFSASHTTIIPAAEKLLSQLIKHPHVKKISLGIIRRARVSPGVKIISLNPTTLLATVRGSTAIQEIRVYVSDTTAVAFVRDYIEGFF